MKLDNSLYDKRNIHVFYLKEIFEIPLESSSQYRFGTTTDELDTELGTYYLTLNATTRESFYEVLRRCFEEISLKDLTNTPLYNSDDSSDDDDDDPFESYKIPFRPLPDYEDNLFADKLIINSPREAPRSTPPVEPPKLNQAIVPPKGNSSWSK